MGKETAISWCDSTWNPWQGCHPVSEGCAHCYMYREKKRYGQDPAVVVRSKDATFRKPLHWREPARVFTCSWSDFFIEEADPWRDEAWDVIRQTPHLTYLILTKRIENVENRLPPEWRLPNVWLGATIESEKNLYRLDELIAIPATIHFVSVEPMLGDLPFTSYLVPCPRCAGQHFEPALRYLDWVIVGGESGPGARPLHPDWVRSLRDECQEFSTPFFFKQWGEWISKGQIADLVPDEGWVIRDEWREALKTEPEWGAMNISGEYLPVTTTWNGRQSDPRDDYEVSVYRVGKARAGDLLDGVQWHQFPEMKGA